MPTHIRLATLADAAQVQEIYAPFCQDSPVSFEIRPPSEAETASRIATVTQTYPWLVCQRGNEILGYAYACQHRERAAYRWAVDVSVYNKVGFKSGAWHDVGWWVLVLRNPIPDPPEPLPIAELDSSSPWQDAIRQGERAFGARCKSDR